MAIQVKAVYMTPKPEVLRTIFSALLATKSPTGIRHEVRLRDINIGVADKNFSFKSHFDKYGQYHPWKQDYVKCYFWSPINGMTENKDMVRTLGAILARANDMSIRGMCIVSRYSKFVKNEDGSISKEFRTMYDVFLIPPPVEFTPAEIVLTPEEEYRFANGPHYW